MNQLSRWVIVVLLACAAVAFGVSAQQQRVNPDAKTLQDFKARVDQYMAVRNRVKKQVPLKESAQAAEVKASVEGLAAGISSGRATAKQGDIFTPEIAQLFRRLMYPEVKGPDGPETKKAIKDDAPAPGTVSLKINARYPDSQPLPTVPPNLLANLPKLPEGLEYRIVANNLILRDADANLIIDFIPKAIQ